MATTRKTRVPREQQLQLINECRQSGLTDADWCREHDIAPSTFYNWVSRLRSDASSQITRPSYGHSDLPLPKQEVVPVSLVPETYPDIPQPDPARRNELYLDNSHTIEVVMQDMTIRITNEADPLVLAKTLRLLRELAC